MSAFQLITCLLPGVLIWVLLFPWEEIRKQAPEPKKRLIETGVAHDALKVIQASDVYAPQEQRLRVEVDAELADWDARFKQHPEGTPIDADDPEIPALLEKGRYTHDD